MLRIEEMDLVIYRRCQPKERFFVNSQQKIEIKLIPTSSQRIRGKQESSWGF